MERLNCDTVDCRSVDVDWSEAFKADDPDEARAQVVYPAWSSAAQCIEWMENEGRDCDEWRDEAREDEVELDEADVDDLARLADEALDLAQENECLHPAMNCAYPLPGLRSSEAGELQAKLLAEGPCLILVELEEDYALALTGGGMDLSWEIAEAHMLCGYRPPAWLSLPRMAEDQSDERHQRIARAVVESDEVLARWCAGRIESAQRFLEPAEVTS